MPGLSAVHALAADQSLGPQRAEAAFGANGYHHASPGLETEVQGKLDELLTRVPRSSFWRNTAWAIAGYVLAKTADFGLYYFFDV